eukprot:scaffold64_cov338-Pavlova_lutheri.AAC.74
MMRAKLFGESSDEEEDVEDDDLAMKRKQMKEKLAAMSKGKNAKKKGKKGNAKGKRQKTEGPSSAQGGGGSEDDSEGEANEEDEAFIVQERGEEGSVPWAGGDSEEDELVYQEEAEEENIADYFKSKGKRKQRVLSLDEIRKLVHNLLEKMENAAREDQLANERKEPAFAKLKMMNEMEIMLCNLQLQEEFLDQGLLSILNSWLERLPDGSLPNTKVRTAVLRVLDKLPIDLQHHDRREQLKSSSLGRTVMFLYKLPEETALNKKLARDLVQKWSRPIFELSTRFKDLPRHEMVRMRKEAGGVPRPRRDAEEEDSEEDSQEEDGKARNRSGPFGSANRARPSRPTEPEPLSASTEQTKKLQKKLQLMGRKKGRAGNKAGLSIEGRGLLL